MELLILILMIVILIYKRRSRINLIRLLKNLSYFICYLFMYVRPIIHGVDQLFIMQGKLFQRCTHLLYCSVLSLGANVNTRRMSKPDMGAIFRIKKSMKYSGHMKLLCELSKLSKLNAFNLLGY